MAAARTATKSAPPKKAPLPLEYLADKDPTPTHVRFAEWAEENGSPEIDIKTVQVVLSTYGRFQKSDENQAAIQEAKERNAREAEERAARKQERAAAKVERDAARAAKAAEKAAKDSEKAPAPPVKKTAAAAKTAAPKATAKATAKPAPKSRRTAKAAASDDFDGDDF